MVLNDLTIIVRPLCYQQTTDFSVRNFQLQQQMAQVYTMKDDEPEKKVEMTRIYQELASLRNDVFAAGIESIDTGKTTVTERAYIAEWLDNVDSAVMKAITKHIESNQARWATPAHKVKCNNCEHEDSLTIKFYITIKFYNTMRITGYSLKKAIFIITFLVISSTLYAQIIKQTDLNLFNLKSSSNFLARFSLPPCI